MTTRTTYSTSHGSPSNLTSSHPFTHQLDLLLCLPNPVIEENLRKIEGEYYKGRLELSDVLDTCYDLTGRYSTQIDFLALSEGQVAVEDVWCIDHRGLLTLALTKETYQQLGLVGEKASKKSDVHYVQVDLFERTSSLFTRAKERIRLWDERRKEQGVLPWRVYLQGGPSTSLQTKLNTVKIQPQYTALHDIQVPILYSSKREFANLKQSNQKPPLEGDEIEVDIHGKEDEDPDTDEAIERTDGLFEWVGMACLASDRLKANDRVNPYVAQYEVPTPYRTGSVSHIRWTGFLGPGVVRRVLEAVINLDSATAQKPGLIAMTANLFRSVPVSYISPKAFAEGAKDEMRLGRWKRDVECWSLILKPSSITREDGEDKEEKEMEWVLASVESTQ